MTGRTWMGLWIVAAAVGTACDSGQQQGGSATTTAGGESRAAAGSPLTTRNMEAVKGQETTCSGPREKSFEIDVVELTVDLGMGTTFAAWTYDGRIPGPTLEVCEGDSVEIRVNNKGTTSHGLDTHAFKIDATHYGPTPPGTTLVLSKVVDTPGVFMYHCAAGPVTDLHIKSGIHGAMIVYPRDEQLRPAREIVVGNDPANGCLAPTMLRLMMRPPPCCFMCGIAARAVRICANTLISMSFCQALSSTTSNGRCPVPPALLTTA